MTVAVDTNILFDILLPDSDHVDRSLEKLTRLSRKHRIIICEGIYAELASQFGTHEALVKFMSETGIGLVNTNREALWAASQAWRDYTDRRTGRFQCSSCGEEMEVLCHSCDKPVRSRQHVITDFLIGGHALILAEGLLTRDRGYYRRYFPRLKLY